MKSNSRARRERRDERREAVLRRLEETLTPLPDGAAEHMKSIAEESGRAAAQAHSWARALPALE